MADTFVDDIVCFNHTDDTDMLYGTVRAVSGGDAGKIRDVVNSAWDAHPASGSLDDYDISAGTASGGLWIGKFPNLAACPAGFYVYQIRLRAGDTPDYSDSVLGAEKGYWNGSVFARIALDSGGRVGLANDTITSAKYDESTAFPVSEKQSKAASTIVLGTIDTAAFEPTTTEFEADDITEATPDHFQNLVIKWTSGVLKDQGTEITAYTLTGGRGHFTVIAMTEAPANNDTFVIV